MDPEPGIQPLGPEVCREKGLWGTGAGVMLSSLTPCWETLHSKLKAGGTAYKDPQTEICGNSGSPAHLSLTSWTFYYCLLSSHHHSLPPCTAPGTSPSSVLPPLCYSSFFFFTFFLFYYTFHPPLNKATWMVFAADSL